MKNKIMTMNKMYGDGSEHLAYQKCGFCITCGDCNCKKETRVILYPENKDKLCIAVK